MGERVPGSLGSMSWDVCRVDGGTTMLTNTARPGPTGLEVSVDGMPLEQRFSEMLYMTGPKLPGEIQEEFMNMLTPTNLAIMVGVLAAWAGSHYIGIGFIADAILLIGGVALLGWQIFSAAEDFMNAISVTYNARTKRDLDTAATHLANFIAVVGVSVLMALLLKRVAGSKGAKGVKGKTTGAAAGGAAAGMLAQAASRAGMTVRHFRAFLKASREMKQIIAVRFTNPRSIPWIEKGFPAKPLTIKANTGAHSGIVTVAEASNPAKRAKDIQEALDAGYLIMDPDGIARGAGGRTLDLRNRADWPVEAGQVIDPTVGKPLVGDYDLLAVIDPSAPGRNITLAASDGAAVANRTNPIIERVSRYVNELMGEQRVMHGAHDTFGDLNSAIKKQGDGSIVFFPDGEFRLMETLDDVEEFYRLMGRQTVKGKYNAITPGGYSPMP